jgi:hypothetical protein
MAGSVRGYVVRAGGGDTTPLPEASVSVLRGPAAAPDIAALADDSGWFMLDGLAEGDWQLVACGPNGERGEVAVRVYDDSVSDTVIKARPLPRRSRRT